jgi:hypothetical protein
MNKQFCKEKRVSSLESVRAVNRFDVCTASKSEQAFRTKKESGKYYERRNAMKNDPL